MDFRYDAFFSYRHKPLDADITQRTFNLVESYRLPKTLRDRGFEEVQRAFRDTEELPVSRVLTATIDQALRSTKCLIVVCSTDTPSSEWIDREVAGGKVKTNAERSGPRTGLKWKEKYTGKLHTQTAP